MLLSRLRLDLSLTIAFVVLALATPAHSKDKKKRTASGDPQDSIEVVGHIAASGAPVTRFIATRHYSSYYLYVEHQAGNNLTLVDVSHASHPVVLSDVPYPSHAGAASLVAVAGTAALVADQGAAPDAAPQTLRIMDFSDPQHPKVAREFTGVTAMSRDERRGLIFLANADGIWILHQSFALDPEVEKEYAHHVIYDH